MQFGLIEVIFSKQGDAWLSARKPPRVKLGGGMGGSLLLGTYVPEGKNGGVWCRWGWGWVNITKSITIFSLLVVTVKVVLE